MPIDLIAMIYARRRFQVGKSNDLSSLKPLALSIGQAQPAILLNPGAMTIQWTIPSHAPEVCREFVAK
jgi:hypothetical protein